ncbi:MAG: hypothetical protein U0168_29210 [Nannocystaceae bacterium]
MAALTAAASLREAQANLEEAKRELDRNESPLFKRIVDAAEVDLARTTLVVARTSACSCRAAAGRWKSKKGADWAGRARGGDVRRGRPRDQAGAARSPAHRRAVGSSTAVSRSAEVGAVVQPGTELMRMTLDGPPAWSSSPTRRTCGCCRWAARGRVGGGLPRPALRRYDRRVHRTGGRCDARHHRLAVPQPLSQLRTDGLGRDRGRAAKAARRCRPVAVRDLATAAQPWVLSSSAAWPRAAT